MNTSMIRTAIVVAVVLASSGCTPRGFIDKTPGNGAPACTPIPLNDVPRYAVYFDANGTMLTRSENGQQIPLVEMLGEYTSREKVCAAALQGPGPCSPLCPRTVGAFTVCGPC